MCVCEDDITRNTFRFFARHYCPPFSLHNLFPSSLAHTFINHNTMDGALDKLAKGIDTAQPKVEEAVRKTLGEDAAKKVHDVIEKIEHALEDVSIWGRGKGRRGVGQAGSENVGNLVDARWERELARNSACSASPPRRLQLYNAHRVHRGEMRGWTPATRVAFALRLAERRDSNAVHARRPPPNQAPLPATRAKPFPNPPPPTLPHTTARDPPEDRRRRK